MNLTGYLKKDPKKIELKQSNCSTTWSWTTQTVKIQHQLPELAGY